MAQAARAALIHVFKAGRQITGSGTAIEFAEGDLQAIAAAYDPAKHEAPICVGHPRSDLPAYGWVAGMVAREGGLYAEPRQVDPQFAELVRQGRFKKVSMAFYDKVSPRNPVPGVYYPRHVAFLGAEPPAVKGLQAVEFSDTDAELLFAELEFSDPAFGYIARAFRGLRDFLIDKFDLDTAEKVLPEWDISSIDELGRERSDPRQLEGARHPAFSEGTRTTETDVSAEKIAQLEADLAAEKRRADDAAAALQANQAAAIAATRTARHDAHVAFAETLVSGDQLLPADKALVVAALDAAAGDLTGKDGKPIEFGEGDQAKPLAEQLQGLFAKLPKHALTGEHLARKGEHRSGVGAAEDPLEFAEGTRVDDTSLARHREALALAKDKGISYAEAAREIAYRR